MKPPSNSPSLDLLPLFMQASMGVIVFDPISLTIELANKSANRLVANDKQNIEGKNLIEIWPEPGKSLAKDAIDSVLANGLSVRLEEQPFGPNSENGHVRYYNFTFQPVSPDDGDPKIILLTEDATEFANLKRKSSVEQPAVSSRNFREKEETFRLLIENSKDGISLTDANGITIYISPAAQKILGYSETEITGRHGREHIHPEDAARLKTIFNDFSAGKCITYEMRVMHKDGKYRCIEVSTTNLLHVKGIESIVSNFRDVTEQKLHEQESLAREKELWNLANAMPQLVWIAEADGSVSYYNERIFEYAGATKNENAWNWSPLVHPDDMEKTQTAWMNSVRNKKPYSVEHRVKMRDGSYRFHLSRAYPQLTENGEVIKWFGTATDIAEQKDAQALLEKYAQDLAKQVEERTNQFKKQKEFAEIVLDSSVDVVAVYDSEMRLMMANKKFYEKFNLDKDQATGKRLLEIFPEGEEGYKRLEKALAGENLFYPAFKSKFTDRYFESYITPLKDERDHVYAALVIAHDVTQTILATEMLRQSADQLKSANDSLVKQNEELEQFAYVASHDLQEPLRKITTFARMLEKAIPSNPEDVERYLQKIIQSSNRMSQLIRDVLKFSQLNKADAFSEVDLNEILTSIMTDLELLIEQKKAIINFQDLPVIQAVHRQMTQLFYNLISNSLKFSRDGEQIRIDISCTKISPEEANSDTITYYKLTFSDNGIGFNQSYADKIFMMFQRLNTREQYSGSGIGLAMVKKIVSNHQGYVVAEGQEGAGASFHVILPEHQGEIHKQEDNS